MTVGSTIAVVGARGIAAELGKKGTQSDITLFNAVHDGRAHTFVEPTQFPEKLAPLLVALAMADRTLFVVRELTREVAETAAVVDLHETPVELLLGPSVGEAELRRAFTGTRLEGAPSRPLDLPSVRAEVAGWATGPVEGPVHVPLDHAFPVKGVGAVALGVVRRGTLTAHDTLRLYPTERTVEVRSLQVHDVDVRTAGTGERVGVALRGIDADELARGQALAPDGALRVGTRLAARLERACPYYRGRFAEGGTFPLSVGLASVPATVRALALPHLELALDRPVAFPEGASAILADPGVPAGPRVIGRVRLEGTRQA